MTSLIPHNTNTDELLKSLNVIVETGLDESEAKSRLTKYGENKLREKKKKTLLQRFFDQFKDAMIIILLIAAAISFAIAIYEGHPKEFFEPFLILFIVILNAAIGVAQESKAEKALEALKSMSALKAKVIRSGVEKLIDSHEIVPGDIIRLEAGDFVPADARLVKSSSLKSEESALTGESVASEKDATAVVKENAPLGDRINMVYSGCSITYGTAFAVVTATGMETEIGKIAGMLDNEGETKTPLQIKLEKLGKYLGFLALAVCGVIFIIGLIDKIPVMDIFMTSVALAVSAIPEGLPAIVTIVLSIGVQRMVKKNAIIRSLPAVETLGSASVICSDKTGTLTQNRMTLVKAYVDGGNSLEQISSSNTAPVIGLLEFGTLCSNGSIRIEEDGTESHIGDPTETSIVLAAHKNGSTQNDLNSKYPRIAEIPFDSDRKLMSTINSIGDKKIVIVKGAFDVLSSRCIKGDIENARLMNDEMSDSALRVIAIAYKEISQIPEKLKPEEIEKDLIFMGLVGMIDPPRPEAKEAVSICRKAGIKPVMITGDHVKTASAIAKELGILTPGDGAITGPELDAMSDEELDSKVDHISVYARVSPENKIRIVKAWQKKDQVVAMTGDGVNDAPALKAADIGCAMGITGTDVAKGAADMTLTDDNFATIVDAVEEGRGIYANIKKVVGFLLGTNIGEVLTVFLAMLIWRKTPLISMQLLWINLVTDSLPAIALGMEAVEKGIMNHKPKPKNESIFAGGLGLKVVLQGTMFALLTLTGFFFGDKLGTSQGQTMAFMVLATCQIVQAYNMRSDHSVFKLGVFTNKKLNFAAIVSILSIALVLFTPVSEAFGLSYLPFQYYLLGLILSFIPLGVMELIKAITAKKESNII